MSAPIRSTALPFLRERTWVAVLSFDTLRWAAFQATAGWKYPGIRPFDLYKSLTFAGSLA